MNISFDDNLTINETTLPIISQLAERLPGGFFICHADGDGELIYFNSFLPSLFGFDGKEEFKQYIGNSFRGIVHPEDYTDIEKEIRAQVTGGTDGVAHIRYRFIRKDGKVGMMDDYGHLSHSETFGDIFYVFVQDITRQHIEETAHQENVSRIMVLEDNFESLYDVDLESGEYEFYIKGQTFSDRVNNKLVNHGDFFSDSVKNSEVLVHPEDIEGFLNVLKPEFIRKVLSKNSSYDYFYRLMSEDSPVWYRMRIVYKDESKSNVIIGIFNAEEETADREKKKNRRNEIVSQMLGGESTYIINTRKNRFKVIQRNRYLDANYSEDESYTDSISRYIENDVCEADREKIRQATSLEYFREHLKSETELSEIFRDSSSGFNCWYKMRAVRISASEVILGFINIDREYYDDLIRKTVDSDYFGMYVADLDAQTFKIAKTSPYYTAGKPGDIAPFKPAVMGFAMANEGETKEFFKNLCSVEYIKKTFAAENKISYTYKSQMVNGNKWVTVECMVLSRHEDGSVAMFALGFRLADALATEKNDLQEKLDATRVVMETLTEDFGCVNYVEFKASKEDDLCVNFRTSELLKELVPGWEAETHFKNKIGMLCDSVVYQPEKEQFYETVRRERIFEELKKENTYFVDFKVFFHGEIKYYQIKVSAVRSGGELTGMVVGIHSVDEYVKKELAIKAQLKEALEAAEKANTSKTKFLFNMSHDIRTPMNAILGFSNMARKNVEDTEKVSEYLSKIEISGQQLLTLINQILEMSRIESGKIEIDDNPINIINEYGTMVTVLSEQAKVSGLDFTHSANNLVHNNLIVDKAKVNSILLNITGNAMKYTPKGGQIDFAMNEIPARKEGYASFLFSVSDTGIGMSEEYLKVLFEPFTREKSSTVSKIQGTGLGMSIVKELVKLMDGDIEVRSKLGQGTRFDVTLDFKIDTEADSRAEAEQKEASISLSGRKVLLVEDNELNREIAIDILTDEGMVVDEAEDGSVAVEAIKARGPEYYDFVLMDVQMPVMNGYEATKAIREMFPDSKLPIIALSANAFAEDKATSIAAGMNDHVAKPINIQELINVLAKYI